MMIPGTMKDIPQADETKTPAIREPRMFPTEVCEFHTPMMKPRLLIEKTNKQTNTQKQWGHLCWCITATRNIVTQWRFRRFWILLKGPDIWLHQRVAHSGTDSVSLVAQKCCDTEVKTKSQLLWSSPRNMSSETSHRRASFFWTMNMSVLNPPLEALLM